jgi:16S rRNA (cytidine1402-2'-O)-methyltransferase
VTGKGTGRLLVVATPIGNLGDLSPRAAEALREADVVAAEDTRRTLKLFGHLGVQPPAMLSLPAFDERGRMGAILDRLREGQTIALCSDAGTPGISDPGAALVAAAWEIGAKVIPIPGPSAAASALAASGFPADRFYFAGFLPRKGGARRDALAAMARIPATLVLYEAGNRTADTLRDLAEALGDRRALVARELTKLHEQLERGPLTALADRFAGEVRGEVTLVVEPPPEGGAPVAEETAESLEAELLRRLEAGEPPSGVARDVARARGLKRSDVYDEIERIKGR